MFRERKDWKVKSIILDFNKLNSRVNINKVYFKIGFTLIKNMYISYGVHMRFVGEC